MPVGVELWTGGRREHLARKLQELVDPVVDRAAVDTVVHNASAHQPEILHRHAIEGYQGSNGLMPPKGGRADLPDEVIRAGVDYMVEHSR